VHACPGSEGFVSETRHTPEPWFYCASIHSPTTGTECILADNTGRTIARAYNRPIVESNANAKRIVSCVNACAGIDPEAVPEMLNACERAAKMYDELAFSNLKLACKYGDEYEPPTDADLLAVRQLLCDAIEKAKGASES
jgi:hypothetical protein